MKSLWILGIVGLLITGCNGNPAASRSRLPNDIEKGGAMVDDRLVAANTRFGFALFEQLVKKGGDQNIFISPPSVALALAMTYNGADGKTRKAMADALELTGMDLDEVNKSYAELLALLQSADSSVEVSIANSLWARQGLPFKEDFLQRARDYYAARVSELDFRSPDAAPTINRWVNENTRGKIDRIVGNPINPATVMLLINAVYFKGTWTYEFDRSLTVEAPFTLPDGGTVTVPFMRQSGNYRYLRGDGFQAVSLPYGTKRLSMYVFLPDAGVGMDQLQQKLTADNWRQWMSEFQEMEGELFLPRFRIEYKKKLNEALTALGMGVAFSPAHADFGNMFPISPEINLYISKVKHKSFVEVNEEGTEAAAVTSVDIVATTARGGPERFHMIMDHPFFFAIRDNRTGTILFTGLVVDP